MIGDVMIDDEVTIDSHDENLIIKGTDGERPTVDKGRRVKGATVDDWL